MSVPIRDFLKRRRDRAVGSILGFAERELFASLTVEQQQAFRRVVLDAANGYHDSVLDLVKAEDGIRNDVVVEAIERLERRIADQGRSKAGFSVSPTS
jgi:hypothetical protein